MITHVAIKFEGKVYSLPKPNRHYHVLKKIMDETGVDVILHDEQGFLTDDGVFIRRVPALIYARTHNQILDEKNVRPPSLFSEDLW